MKRMQQYKYSFFKVFSIRAKIVMISIIGIVISLTIYIALSNNSNQLEQEAITLSLMKLDRE